MTDGAAYRATASEVMSKIREYWEARVRAGDLTDEETELVKTIIQIEEEKDDFMII